MIGFMLSGWLHSHEAHCYQTNHTYNALYVSVSGGFCIPCMVFDSIMSQITDAIGFYIGYFGYVTKYVSWPENQGIFFFLYFSNIANEPDIFHGFPP